MAVMIAVGCGRTATVTEYVIVPEPVFAVQKEGSFALNNTPSISVVGLGQNSSTVKYVMQSLRHAHMRPRLVSTSQSSDMLLTLYDTLNPELGDEGYLLEVRSTGIVLRANTERGLFYAYQTLVQMLPDDVTKVSYRTIELPECTVLDRPRFGWRGVQMDAGHYAFSVREMRKWVDLLAAYKMNRLHLVLGPDDESLGGDELDELTEYAANRGVVVLAESCEEVADSQANPSYLLCKDLKEGLAQARAGYAVVMSPQEHFDLATYQANPRYQPASSEGVTTLAKVYEFDPAPMGTNSHVVANVLGGMCRMNTELIGSARQAEYMLLPRMLAVSECLWSRPDRKDWMRFRRKVEVQKDRLDVKGYHYCEGSFTPLFTVRRIDDESVNIAITTEVPNTYIFYTTDLGTPTRSSSIYLGPINLKRGTHIKILPVYNDIERDSVYEFVIK